jgi:hypothetical protein
MKNTNDINLNSAPKTKDELNTTSRKEIAFAKKAL